MQTGSDIVLLESLFICGLGLLFITAGITTLKDAWIQANIKKRTESSQAEVVYVKPSRGNRTVKLRFRDISGNLIETICVTRRFLRVGDEITVRYFANNAQRVAMNENWSIVEYGFTCSLGGLGLVSGIGSLVVGLSRLISF